VPEDVRNTLGVSEASYLKPLVYGLSDPRTGLELLVDVPSQLAVNFQKRTESHRCAFLSPIDYARHGGDYLIVPGVGVSSSSRTDTIQLFINPNTRNIRSIAVDIRVTSEIILAKIILAEKFPNEDAVTDAVQFIPMLPDRDAMLSRADAALMINFHPVRQSNEHPFALDLVEEWNEFTGLPYVHGVWIGHDAPEMDEIVASLVHARDRGAEHLAETAEVLSRERNIPREFAQQYLSSFSYSMGDDEQQGFSEFIRYAYYHGVIRDIPELNFFETPPPPAQSVN
jgi:chorismate dehydratase